MKTNEEIKIMKKIISIINKKYCKGKLKIDKLFFFKKHKKKYPAFYEISEDIGDIKNKKRNIGISSELDVLYKFRALIHELSHAYLDQITNVQHEGFLKHLGKRQLCVNDKEYIKKLLTHDKEFKKVEKMFLKTLDKHLKISVRG